MSIEQVASQDISHFSLISPLEEKTTSHSSSPIKDKKLPEQAKDTDNDNDENDQGAFQPRKGNRHTCPKCSKSFKTSYELRTHMHLHIKYTKKCPICDKSYKESSYLITHILRHPSSVNTSKFRCLYNCGAVLSSKKLYKSHMKKHTRTVKEDLNGEKTCVESHIWNENKAALLLLIHNVFKAKDPPQVQELPDENEAANKNKSDTQSISSDEVVNINE